MVAARAERAAPNAVASRSLAVVGRGARRRARRTQRDPDHLSRQARRHALVDRASCSTRASPRSRAGTGCTATRIARRRPSFEDPRQRAADSAAGLHNPRSVDSGASSAITAALPPGRSRGPPFSRVIRRRHRLSAPCNAARRAGVRAHRRGLRHRSRAGARRGRRVVRPAGVHDGRTAGPERPREPRSHPQRHPQLRLRVPAAPRHRQPRAGRRPQGGLGVRSADRARHPRGDRRRRAAAMWTTCWCWASCRSTAAFRRRAACCRSPRRRARRRFRGLLLPAANSREAAVVGGLDFYPVQLAAPKRSTR